MALVQSSGLRQVDNAGSSTTFNAPGNFTAGNAVVFPVSHYNGAASRISGMTIGGVAGVRAPRQTGSSGGVNSAEIWYWATQPGGTSAVVISFAASSDNYVSGSFEEHSGWDASPLDQQGVKSTSVGTSPTVSTAGAISTANQVVVGVAVTDTTTSNAGWGTPTGFTQSWVEQNSTVHEAGHGCWRTITGASGVQTVTWSQSSGLDYIAAVATFKLAAAGSSGSASGRAGTLNSAASTKANTSPETGRTGTRGSSVSTKAGASAETARTGARGLASTAKTVTTSASGRAGGSGLAVGTPATGITSAVSATLGARGTAVATKAVTTQAVGRAGAAGNAGATKVVALPSAGRTGVSGAAQSTKAADATASAAGRTGGALGQAITTATHNTNTDRQGGQRFFTSREPVHHEPAPKQQERTEEELQLEQERATQALHEAAAAAVGLHTVSRPMAGGVASVAPMAPPAVAVAGALSQPLALSGKQDVDVAELLAVELAIDDEECLMLLEAVL